ncbi:MAG: hypothetical protein RLW87_06970 [Alphaproteobacteria bacterium]
MFEHLSEQEIRDLIERPQIRDFISSAVAEAAHQRARWGEPHDADKQSEDWFWTVGYLAGKSLAAQRAGDAEKAKHHLISTTAVLAHWHEAMSTGSDSCGTGGMEK